MNRAAIQGKNKDWKLKEQREISLGTGENHLIDHLSLFSYARRFTFNRNPIECIIVRSYLGKSSASARQILKNVGN